VSKNSLLAQPVVSIVIPFYNSYDSIDRCLESISIQIYRDFEVIVVDDGSTDSFSKTYAKFISNNSQIKCATHSSNLGVSAARNTGISESNGKFIFFLDADDWLGKHALSNLIKQANTNSELVVAPHNQYISSENIKKKSYLVNSNEALIDKDTILKYVKNYLYLPYEYIMFVHCWNKLYSSKIIKNNRILFETDLSQLEDVNFNFKYLKFVSLISFSNTFDYFHYIENKSNSASGLAGSETSSVEMCLVAFSSVKDYLEFNITLSEDKKLELLGHHFVSTAIIYLIRMTRAFIKKPNFSNYKYIKRWVESCHLLSNVNYYKVKNGESHLIKVVIKSGSTNLVIFACIFRILNLKFRMLLNR